MRIHKLGTITRLLAVLLLLGTATLAPVPGLAQEFTIGTIAGTAERDFIGDGGTVVQARLNVADGVAVDGAGAVYFADRDNHRIRRVDPSGAITTIAGTGQPGFSRDGGPAVQARLDGPAGVALDGAGAVYFADLGNHRIRRVDPSGIITTIAGTGQPGFSGDGGSAVQARLNVPVGVAVDGTGAVYFADSGNHRIRRVDPSGIITTIAGTGEPGFSGDGGPAVRAQLGGPSGVAVDGAGGVYFVDRNNDRVRRVDPSGVITTIARNRRITVNHGSAGMEGVAVDGAGAVYFIDPINDRIRRVDPSGVITTIAGPVVAGRGEGTASGAGAVYLADPYYHRIRRVYPPGASGTIAGTGEPGFSGDGGPAVQARLNGPNSVAVDRAGGVYLADRDNHRIRRVDPSGIITTIAGTGERGFSGDGGPAVQAQLDGPEGVEVDEAGGVYFVDRNNDRVRRVDPSGVITTIQGTGEGGATVQGRLGGPAGVAVDGAGAVYFADSVNDRIHKLTPTGGAAGPPR